MSRNKGRQLQSRNPPEYSGEIPGAIDALAQLLRGELAACGLTYRAERPGSVRDFTHWYLQVVQLLEAHVAGGAGLQPMARSEVELMCRCALSGENLRHSMSLCQQYCTALHPRAGKLKTVQTGGTVAFRLDSLRAEVSSASSLCDITGLFAFYQLFQWLAGVDLQLQQVRIGPIDREDVLPFLKLFGAPVLAGGRDYALEFPAQVLDLPVVRTASEFEQFFEVYPCGVFRSSVNDMAEQVAALLSASARHGGGLPRQEEVARILGLALSTFRRRLALAGTPFHQLREDCLREQSETLLTRGGNSIADIAARLGYSDTTAFRRAFKRSHNCSPREWQHKQTT